MKKKADLVYRKSTGRLVGYTDLGNVNDELRLFESRVQSEEYRQGFATHVIVYMVRGIFRNLVYLITSMVHGKKIFMSDVPNLLKPQGIVWKTLVGTRIQEIYI